MPFKGVTAVVVLRAKAGPYVAHGKTREGLARSLWRYSTRNPDSHSRAGLPASPVGSVVADSHPLVQFARQGPGAAGALHAKALYRSPLVQGGRRPLFHGGGFQRQNLGSRLAARRRILPQIRTSFRAQYHQGTARLACPALSWNRKKRQGISPQGACAHKTPGCASNTPDMDE
jgi:hypothetical protein